MAGPSGRDPARRDVAWEGVLREGRCNTVSHRLTRQAVNRAQPLPKLSHSESSSIGGTSAILVLEISHTNAVRRADSPGTAE